MYAQNPKVWLVVATLLVIQASPLLAAESSPDTGRESILKIVTQIKRADYEGDRAALAHLYSDLAPFNESKTLGSRVRYWRGFALWRRAINGFNETPTPTDLEADLQQAVVEFREAIAKDPAFVDAKIGAGSCLGYLLYLNHKDPARVQDLISQSSPLLKDAMAAEPDNPRLLWVLGPIRWSSPPERGGGQDKAIATYQKGLDALHAHKSTTTDPLEPSWGEPELFMSLAWSHLNQTTPDLKAAEREARSALDIVPYWHYVRDILIPQIQEAKAKVAAAK